MELPEMSDQEVNRRKRDMSHWLKLANVLYKCKDEHEILKTLKVEIETLGRVYVIQRVYAHFNSLRRQRELNEILKSRKILNKELPNEILTT